ncbi:YgdI/YgdR family lipoprotein [Biostraticola tofi]|uniref:Uncharacterized protein DUF903 n=1 Tax=Biostraticola tofi TaxID=466109 RepID=A0A4R3Z464_9GAMM|nr:YgdI/YgdR family lipoprotein [Biostraticola tofi]TCW00078.1 uncharacterized protein DUF903 [Biostraticola tofi]
MKKVLYVLSAVVLSVSLAGCAGNNYAMHTNDGRTIVSEGKPKVDDHTGMISYKDANGTKQQINRNDIKEMVEIK